MFTTNNKMVLVDTNEDWKIGIMCKAGDNSYIICSQEIKTFNGTILNLGS